MNSRMRRWLAAAAILVPLASGAATYTSASAPYAWISTSGHTTVVWTGAPGGPAAACTGSSAASDDDISDELPIGFSYTFGTTVYTTARVMTNGRLQFSNPYCETYIGPNIPSTNLPRTMRIYGEDLDPSAGGSVTYKSIGTAPNRQFVVTWTNVPAWNRSASKFNLQIILNEDGSFIYQYGAASGYSTSSRQVGWELTTSDWGTYTYTTIASLASTAIRWTNSSSMATPSGFNAFDTGTAAGSITGALTTRVAEQLSTVDVVALNAAGTGLHSGFTGTVSLTWLDARDDTGALTGSCRSSWAAVGAAGAAGSAVFAAASRVSVAVTPPATATRKMRLRMNATVGASTVTACSSDAFAVIPSTYTLSATDADASTAGSSRSLNNLLAVGGNVHRAGRPFTVTAQARGALGTLMTSYDGTPTLSVVGCVLPVGCSAGTLTATTLAASGGTYTNATVSYSDVGVISVQLSDSGYAAVDAADTSAVARTASSPALSVGRFVPDGYALSVSTPGQFATANGACMATGSGATFVNQGFGWATAPVVTVTAQNAAGGTTALWSGTLMKLSAPMGIASMSAIGAGSASVSSSFGAFTVAGLGAGQARYTASSLDRYMLTLPDGTAQASVTPTWTWGFTLSDASEAGVSGNPTLSASTTLAPVSWNQGGAFHSARLVISPAHGDARTGVRQALQLQRYTSAGWVTMTEDRGCVTISRANLEVSSGTGAFAAGLCLAPLVSASVTTSGGRAWLTMPASPSGAQGRMLVRVAGAGATGLACSALGVTAGITPLAMPWLLGGVSAAGPSALATWGRANRDAVWRRESF
ncbi:MAG: hypothetical protein JNN18_05530 [Rubrivivax sp.]|nr:hypothetical protein [Rubrivivax sp.]